LNRILIVSHAPLAAEAGAGQVALQLSDALRALGNKVSLWSPHPLSSALHWWENLTLVREKLNSYLTAQQNFDIIDAPANLITRQVRAKGRMIVARSTQPQLLYLLEEINYPIHRNIWGILQILSRSLFFGATLLLNLWGWNRADFILCLGSLEKEWMKKRFPWYKTKIVSYFNAPSKGDQLQFAEIRKHRKGLSEFGGVRFLWMGRWRPHKGCRELVNFITSRSSSCPEDVFTIAGSGPEAEKDCPLELSRSGRLKVIPSFSRDELYHLLATHDAGLFTSRVEGWGLSLNEMLESGMVVFATNTGGVPDLRPFFKETLRSFPPPEEIELPKSSSPPEAYFDKFSWEKIAQSYMNSISA